MKYASHVWIVIMYTVVGGIKMIKIGADTVPQHTCEFNMQTQQVVTLAHEKQWKGENSECHTGDITMVKKTNPHWQKNW